jgi:triosephosphate isomerase
LQNLGEAMTDIRPLVAGNWKMNGLKEALREAWAVAEGVAAKAPNADVMLCPPATMVAVMAEATAERLMIGGQDCHVAASGAHTGDISAEMLGDAGAAAIIVGHSERRADHGERSQDVAAKAVAVHRCGMTAIICVGETAGERAAGLTLKVIERQLAGSLPDGVTAANTVIAYEPVWAIGTGLTPTAGDVANVHAFIRGYVRSNTTDGDGMRLLYGGSVKAANAAELMAVANVNGALVGGASLKADDFLGIINVYV